MLLIGCKVRFDGIIITGLGSFIVAAIIFFVILKERSVSTMKKLLFVCMAMQYGIVEQGASINPESEAKFLKEHLLPANYVDVEQTIEC